MYQTLRRRVGSNREEELCQTLRRSVGSNREEELCQTLRRSVGYNREKQSDLMLMDLTQRKTVGPNAGEKCRM
jgi:hypothetical protein